MTGTPTLSGYVNYTPAGIRKYYWLATLPAAATPTRAELTAGTDITPEVVTGSLSGWYPDTDTVDIQKAGSRFTGNIDGQSKVDKSSLGIYLSKDGDDARTLFVPGVDGMLVIFPEGDADTLTMDCFPARPLPTMKSLNETDAAAMTVGFAIPSAPTLDVDVPAAS